MLGRIRMLTQRGLDGHMVVLNFVLNRLALLQARQRPTWLYAGRSNPRRLHSDKHDKGGVALIIKDRSS